MALVPAELAVRSRLRPLTSSYSSGVAKLDGADRAKLPDSAFAYVVDGEGSFGAERERAGDGQMVLFAQDGDDVRIENPPDARTVVSPWSAERRVRMPDSHRLNTVALPLTW